MTPNDTLGPDRSRPGLEQQRVTLEAQFRERSASLQAAYGELEAQVARQRQTIESLQESEQRFRTLAESLPHLLWTCRPGGWCEYLNSQWSEYTGCPTEELLGDAWKDHLHPEDRERVLSAWTVAATNGEHLDTEFRMRRADGAYRWFKTRAVPLRDSAGHITRWTGSHTDCETAQQAQRKIATQLTQLSLLDRITRSIAERQDLNSILRVVIRKLEDHLPIDFGCVLRCEAAAGALTVLCIGPRSEVVALQLSISQGSELNIDQNGLSRCVKGELVSEPDLSRVESPFAQVLARGGMQSMVVAPLLAGSNVFGILVAARRESDSFSTADCEFIRQVSEHVGLAAQHAQIYSDLQQAYEELRQTTHTVLQQERLRALGQMASGIAHDINNTISPISLYVESLLGHESGLSDRARQELTIILTAIEDVAQTVARMREFYRPREPQVFLTHVDLNTLVRQVIDLTHSRWSDVPLKRGVAIDVKTELSPDLPAIVGSHGEIRDALTNLVFNAIDAMPEGGTLTLQTSDVLPNQTDGDLSRYACVEVRDTGVGMDEETRRRCIEPFFTTKGERGTGLGLSSVYGMAQRHSGQLQIDSERGRGTAVRLNFPVSADKPISGGRQLPAQAPARGLRILVVDDDPVITTSLQKTLGDDGHFVTVAQGGQAGIDAFAASTEHGDPFAVVITDLGMPYVDGRKVAAAIRAASSTPIILLTGWGQSLIAEKDVPAGVDRVLSKPPRLTELRVALAELTQCDPPLTTS